MKFRSNVNDDVVDVTNRIDLKSITLKTDQTNVYENDLENDHRNDVDVTHENDYKNYVV